MLTILTVGLAGGAAMAAHAWAPVPERAQALAAATSLSVVALALLVGAMWRRGPLLGFVGVVLAIIMAGSVAAPQMRPEGPAGLVTYSASQPVPDQITVQLRETTLDFRSLPPDSPRTIHLSAKASEVTLRLPANVVVEYSLRYSAISTAGEQHDKDGSWRRRLGDGPTLTIILDAQLSEVTLE